MRGPINVGVRSSNQFSKLATISWNASLSTFFSIHRTYICVCRTDGAARIYFILSLSLPERITLWSRIIPVRVRERERGKKKERRRRKKPRKNHIAVTVIWTHGWTLSLGSSMLSIRPRRPALERLYLRMIHSLLSLKLFLFKYSNHRIKKIPGHKKMLCFNLVSRNRNRKSAPKNESDQKQTESKSF